MPDSYLIDGYNLIYALGMIERSQGARALEQSRLRLLRFLEASFADAVARVTVVFDAQHAPCLVPRRQNFHGITILFAPSRQSADDLIESLIEAHAEPKSLVVVSNDNRLKNAARHHGARGWTDADLLDFLERKPDSAGAIGSSEPEKEMRPMSPTERDEWVQEFKGIEQDPALKEFFDLDRFED